MYTAPARAACEEEARLARQFAQQTAPCGSCFCFLTLDALLPHAPSYRRRIIFELHWWNPTYPNRSPHKNGVGAIEMDPSEVRLVLHAARSRARSCAAQRWAARRAVGRQARAFAICAAMADGALMVNGGLHQRRKHQGWVLEENIKARFWSTAQGWSWELAHFGRTLDLSDRQPADLTLIRGV